MGKGSGNEGGVGGGKQETEEEKVVIHVSGGKKKNWVDWVLYLYHIIVGSIVVKCPEQSSVRR